jgi:hypothetical protein
MNANHALISMVQTAFVYMSKEKKPSGALSKLTFGRLMTRLAIVNDFFGKHACLNPNGKAMRGHQ